MMDKKDSRLYYREGVVEKIGLNPFFKRKPWGRGCWTSMFLTSLELDGFDGDLQSRVMALHMTDLMASRARILATNKQK